MTTDSQARAEIKRYVDKAFLAKMSQLGEIRVQREGALRHRAGSMAFSVGRAEIEEDLLAELMHQKADLYIEAYDRKGLKIGPEVLQDISRSREELTSVRRGSLMSQAEIVARRTNGLSHAHVYARFGTKAVTAMKAIEAKIDLYNLTPKKADPMTVTNNNYHLSGVGNRVVHGDDRSVNIINEQQLFEQLAAAITRSVQSDTERAHILATLEELKQQKAKTDYLALIPKFTAAAASIAHVIGPYLPALIERAQSLV